MALLLSTAVGTGASPSHDDGEIEPTESESALSDVQESETQEAESTGALNPDTQDETPKETQPPTPEPAPEAATRQRVAEVHRLLEGLDGEAMRDLADQSFAAYPASAVRVMLLRAGRSKPPGLVGARSDRRRDRRLEARAWVQASFEQSPDQWLELLVPLLDPTAEGTDGEVFAAAVRVVGELGWLEFGPTLAQSLGAEDPRLAESVRGALFALYGRWFSTVDEFTAAWPRLEGRDSNCLSVSELTALETQLDDMQLRMLNLELAAPEGSSSVPPGTAADSPEAQAAAQAQAAEAQRRLALVRALFDTGHPALRTRVVGIVRAAVGRRGLGAEGAIELLIERVTREANPEAFHAVLVVLLELVQGMSAEAEMIDPLRGALLDPSVMARFELGDTLVTSLSRLPWTATGAHDYSAGIGPSAQLIARLAAADRPVDYDRLHLALAAHGSLCQNALQARSQDSNAPVLRLWQVRGLHRTPEVAARTPQDGGALGPNGTYAQAQDPALVLTRLMTDTSLPLEVRLDVVAASPYFLEVLPLLGILQSEHERGLAPRLEHALLDALEVALVHGRFPGQPFLTPFGTYLDQALSSERADLRQRVVALLGNTDLEGVIEELPEGATAPPRRLRRVLLLSVESRLLPAMALADAATQLRYLELLPLLTPDHHWVEGLVTLPVFDNLLDGNQGRPAATLAALVHHLGPPSTEPDWISNAESVLLRLATPPPASTDQPDPATAPLPDHRLRLIVDWISTWPVESLSALTGGTRAQVCDWYLSSLAQPQFVAASPVARSARLQFLCDQSSALADPALLQRVADALAPLPPLAAAEAYPLVPSDPWRMFAGLIDTLEDHTLWLTRRDALLALLVPDAPDDGPAKEAGDGAPSQDPEVAEGAGDKESSAQAESQDDGQNSGRLEAEQGSDGKSNTDGDGEPNPLYPRR